MRNFIPNLTEPTLKQALAADGKEAKWEHVEDVPKEYADNENYHWVIMYEYRPDERIYPKIAYCDPFSAPVRFLEELHSATGGMNPQVCVIFDHGFPYLLVKQLTTTELFIESAKACFEMMEYRGTFKPGAADFYWHEDFPLMRGIAKAKREEEEVASWQSENHFTNATTSTT